MTASRLMSFRAFFLILLIATFLPTNASADELNQAFVPRQQVNDRDLSVFNRPVRQVKTDLIKDENGQPVNQRRAQGSGSYSVSLIIRMWITQYGTLVRVTNNVFLDTQVRVHDLSDPGSGPASFGDVFIPAYNVAEYIVPPGANRVWITAGDRKIFSVALDPNRGQNGIDATVKFQQYVDTNMSTSRFTKTSVRNEAELPLGVVVYYRDAQYSGNYMANLDRHDFDSFYGRTMIAALSLDGSLNPATRVATVEVFDLWNEVK